MRFVTACADCGPVVMPAPAITLVLSAEMASEGFFECPVCNRMRSFPVARGAISALMASGAEVISAPPSFDDDAWRRVLDEAS